jgi:hypothetical protein
MRRQIAPARFISQMSQPPEWFSTQEFPSIQVRIMTALRANP